MPRCLLNARSPCIQFYLPFKSPLLCRSLLEAFPDLSSPLTPCLLAVIVLSSEFPYILFVLFTDSYLICHKPSYISWYLPQHLILGSQYVLTDGKNCIYSLRVHCNIIGLSSLRVGTMTVSFPYCISSP